MQGRALAFLFLQLFPDQSINQSINQSIDQSIKQSNNQSINRSIINWKGLREFTLEICQQHLFGEKNVLMLRTSKWLFQNLCVENKRKGVIDWRGALCSDWLQPCWRMRPLNRNQVMWPNTYGSVHCTVYFDVGMKFFNGNFEKMQNLSF